MLLGVLKIGTNDMVLKGIKVILQFTSNFLYNCISIDVSYEWIPERYIALIRIRMWDGIGNIKKLAVFKKRPKYRCKFSLKLESENVTMANLTSIEAVIYWHSIQSKVYHTYKLCRSMGYILLFQARALSGWFPLSSSRTYVSSLYEAIRARPRVSPKK